MLLHPDATMVAALGAAELVCCCAASAVFARANRVPLILSVLLVIATIRGCVAVLVLVTGVGGRSPAPIDVLIGVLAVATMVGIRRRTRRAATSINTADLHAFPVRPTASDIADAA